MSIHKEYVETLQPLWGNWYVAEEIGEGSVGKVYKIIKEEWGLKFESALKVISIPLKGQYNEALGALENNRENMREYLDDAVKKVVNEIKLLYLLRGNSNIIPYEDHLVIEKSDCLGWDILIRMEYSTPLSKYLLGNKMKTTEVVKLGLDICSALCRCEKEGIIHRDIKEENIFVSNEGTFKLGDFSISKEISNNTLATSNIGTPIYSAPEVIKSEKYDNRADIYSFGLVLYKLLNFGRLPFLPPYPKLIRYNDIRDALKRRHEGEGLPMPCEGDGVFSEIILKACAYRPQDRYRSAFDMKEALEGYLKVREESAGEWFVDLEKGDIYLEGHKETTQDEDWVYL